MPSDLMSILKNDHVVLKDLVSRVQSAGKFRLKQQLTNDLYLLLNTHMEVIETSLLPMLRTFTGHSLPDSFAVHHERIRTLMSDLMAQRLNAHELDAVLARLCCTLLVQCERERLFLLPAVDRAMDADERACLALESCGRLTHEMRKDLSRLQVAAGVPAWM